MVDLYRVMNLQVLYKAGNLFTRWVTLGSSRRTLFHGVGYLFT